MADGNEANSSSREFSQLLRLHEQLLSQFLRSRDELRAPGTVLAVKQIKARTGSEPDLTELETAIEAVIRALKLSKSGLESALMKGSDVSLQVDGVNNLPPYLQRFLGEHAGQPGFSYDVVDDPIRGWILQWKEYTAQGTVRGHGQICERPYAWLED